MIIKEKIKKNYKYILVLMVITLIFALLPLVIIIARHDVFGNEPLLAFNAYGNGAVYYDSRIREIKDGFPFLGNPWFLEYNSKIAPAFLAADWIQAVPLLLGLSFGVATLVSFLFWSLVFVFLAYAILNELELPSRWNIIGVIISYISVYSLMLGPVSMQIVFPFLLLFLLAFIMWLKNPHSRFTIIFLILSSSFSFYIYTYLWQAVLTIIFLTILFLFYTKNKNEFFKLLIVALTSLILAIPLIVFTVKQVTNIYYWESMTRTGFINTHWPAAEAYYSGRWILVMLILWALLWHWTKEYRDHRIYKLCFLFFSMTGIGFEIVSLSNVITGKELELAGHVVRFITVWLALSLTAFVFFVWDSRKSLRNITLPKKIVIIILLGVCFYGVWQYAQSYFFMTGRIATTKQNLDLADYREPLQWLEDNVSEPAVIWVNYREKINDYVTILTKHYVLFNGDGILHFLSNQEAEERYLVAGYMNDIKQSDIEKEYEWYAGIGNSIHPYKLHNRKTKLCRLLFLDSLGYNCGELTDAVSLKGKEYFANLYQRYNEEIVPNINEELRKLQVTYIIEDKECQSNFQPLLLENTALVYENHRFLIYEINR